MDINELIGIVEDLPKELLKDSYVQMYTEMYTNRTDSVTLNVWYKYSKIFTFSLFASNNAYLIYSFLTNINDDGCKIFNNIHKKISAYFNLFGLVEVRTQTC
jgi:hypothetical protein